jgi:type IV pilus assembly protein PilN
MRITLNLASQPYVDLRSILKRLRIVMVVLVVLAVPLWYLLRAERGKAADATARVAAIGNNVRRLQQQQQSYQALMQQPQNAAVLEQSDFLNGLFRRKSFSWTATMTDLETVLPTGVQVMSIDPEVQKDGSVVIHLRVSGARDRAVDLVRNLEKSRHFSSPRLTGEALAQTNSANTGPNAVLPPITASTAVNFEILAAYRPLTVGEEAREEAVSADVTRSSHKRGEASGSDERPSAPRRTPKPGKTAPANGQGAK